MIVGLTAAFIGPVSQAQGVRTTLTASTVDGESEQKIVIINRADSSDITVTDTDLGALDEGVQNRQITLFASFAGTVTLTVTNNNLADVIFEHSGLLNPPASLTTTITIDTPGFGYATPRAMSFRP